VANRLVSASECTKNRFLGGLLPHLLEGTYCTPADPLAGFFGKEKGGKEMRRGRVRKRGRGGETR